MNAALIWEWVIKSIIVLLVMTAGFAYVTWYERKVLARMFLIFWNFGSLDFATVFAAAPAIAAAHPTTMLLITLFMARPQLESEEASLKYFLLGSFASGFILFGMAFLFGAAGSTNFAKILAAVSAGQAQPVFLIVGAALLLIGLGFKIAVVPFHGWAPDVYQGAPSTVTAFMRPFLASTQR